MKLKISLSILITIFLLSPNSYPQDLKGNNYLGRSLNFSAHKTQTVTNQAKDFQKTTDGSIIYVPTDYPIIQDAIDASADGDTVIIEEGTYYQQFKFSGKAIAVGSRFLLDSDTTHISKTILDGTNFGFLDSASLVYFYNGENVNSVLCGLTLQNGGGTYGINQDNGFEWKAGGAISMLESGGTIKNNIIKNCECNSALDLSAGGGIDCFLLGASQTLMIKENKIINNSVSGADLANGAGINFEAVEGKLIIDKNIIQGNTGSAVGIGGGHGGNGGGIFVGASQSDSIFISNNYINNNQILEGYYNDGSGIVIINSKAHIFNNIISRNNCLGHRGRGGAITVGYWDDPSLDPLQAKLYIVNNTLVNNYAKHFAGGIYVYNLKAEIVNNIIRENDDPGNEEIKLSAAGSNSIINYCNVEGGFAGTGNIDVDPMFCDTSYCLLTINESPCIDAGDPDAQYTDVPDPGNPFQALYPALGGTRNDIGAYGGPNSEWGKDIWWNPVLDIEDQFELNPGEFSISQNYPNPFNPSTKINYVIPSGAEGLTTLKIYDILGKEITTLIDEYKHPGTYEVEFNADKLTSGVYFYKLQASEFTATKKMLLVK